MVPHVSSGYRGWQWLAPRLAHGVLFAAIIIGCALSLASDAFASQPAASKPERSAADWNPPTRGERLRARENVRCELIRLQNLLAGRADQVLSARRWRLADLERELACDEPNLASLDRSVAAQTGQHAGTLQSQLNSLRRAVARWRAWSEPEEAYWQAARRGAELLENFSEREVPLTDEEVAELREAFAAVARTHRNDGWVESLRQRFSRPNHRLVVSADYLIATATRTCVFPLDPAALGSSWGFSSGDSVRGAGRLLGHSGLAILDDSHGASFLIQVRATGRVDWSGRRRQVALWAHTDAQLASQQPLRLSTAACELASSQIHVAAETALHDLQRSTRCPLPGRPLEAILARRLESRLPNADAQAAALVEDALRDRVEDEGHELASRIQSVCAAAFWGPLAASEFEPKACLRSSARGVEWEAEYVRHEQLGALSDPPPPAASNASPCDTRLMIHASALRHLAERLSGLTIDEVQLLDVLREQAKLTSDEWSRSPSARRPVVLKIDADQKIEIDLRDRRIQLRIPLSAVEVDGERHALRTLWVGVVYRVAGSSRGLQLVRETLDGVEAPALDVRASVALRRLFPAELHPLPKFQNAAVANPMQLVELMVERGWLTLGARRMPSATPAPVVKTAIPNAAPLTPPSSPRETTPTGPASPVDLRSAQLLYCFQGKGSCLPYDAGVLHECFSRLPAMRDGRTIVAGNSSGSIPAAYFGCFGLSSATVERAVERLLAGDREAVRSMENPQSKTSKLLAGRPTEIPHNVLREYIAFALGVEKWQDAESIDDIVRRSTARPQFPVLIVACNREVLDNRPREAAGVPGGLKEFDLDTMTASWRPEVYEYYRAHPEQFTRDHPDLVLGRTRRIGHAVTYFVDQSLFDLLRQIPAAERQADLRLMVDADDVALAILASVSEPTYFEPVFDPRPERILTGDAPVDQLGSRRRSYYGGYLVALPAQDIRRMLPGVHVVGTGWRHNTLPARRLLSDWLLADVEPVAQQAEWWVELALNPDAEFRSHMDFRDLTAIEEFYFGARRARAGLDSDSGVPDFVRPPRQLAAVHGAWWPEGPREVWVQSGVGAAEERPLRTLRGLGALIEDRRADP
ncbi:MAG: hypothetical protein U0939_18365 [Pirellulales bacterium]